MKLFGRYIAGEKKVITVCILFCLIFAVVFSQYDLPFEAVWYPILLCALAGAFFLVYGYLSAKKKHDDLEHISRMTAHMIDALPEMKSLEEEGYQAVIRSLQAELAELETNDSLKYDDMVEYYTIWVHQIKTPIASMRLKLEKEDSALTRSLAADLFRVEQYVEMVLAFLRLDSASRDYVFKEYQIDVLVRQAVKKFSYEFINRKIALSYEPIEKMVITDEKWFLFVLEQLISNALKYTKEGSVRIYQDVSDPARELLCIEDTGIGIAPEDLPRIFEKGYTGYNGRTDQRASGIGLYLCKRVCDNLGIAIEAASEIGKGTVIRLDLRQYHIERE